MIWKHIKGFENLYLVSECGQVKSVPRIIVRSNGRQHTIVSKILKPAVDKSGYKRVGLMKGVKLIDISKQYGISYHIVKDINRGRTWKHV